MNKKKILIIFTIILMFLVIKFTGIAAYLTFENLRNNKENLKAFVGHNYLLSVVIYIFIYIITVSLSIPGAVILTLAGGYLFGTINGAVYVNIGATIGAGLVFLAARYLLGEWIQKRYKDRLVKFNDEINENGYKYLLIMRFIPVFPFFLINILAALTAIPFITFVWTTSVGIIPGSLVYTFAGSQLNTISSLKDILSSKIIFAFLLLAVFAFIPVIKKKKIKL
ncbi:MAG: TVP38/TMEM64 family protein [bacterium]|nr:TVP38/TMEM64 family protein [bacterium]